MVATPQENPSSPRETPAPLLSARGLAWRFREGGEARLDFDLERGRAWRVAGPSGSGKTTLLKVLARLYPSTRGELLFAGTPSLDMPPPRWRRSILFVPQNPVLFEGTAEENILLPWRIPSRKKEPRPSRAEVEETAARLGLDKDTLERGAGLLSGGEGARVCLARALLSGPQVLLLDEPFAFLDGEAARDAARLLSEWVGRDGRALLLVSHAPPPKEISFHGTLDAGDLVAPGKEVPS